MTSPNAAMNIPTLANVDGAGLDAAHEHFRRIRLEVFSSRGFDAQEMYLSTRDGRRLYILSGGTGVCPTILVHGGVGSTADYALLAPLLRGRVVIADTPGFGLSDAPADGYRDLAGLSARWIADLAAGLRAERVNVLGCSMGGYAAISFAAAHPERVNQLILSGSAGGLFSDVGLFLKLWTLPVIGRIVSNLPMHDIETVRKRMLGPYVGDASALPDDLLEVALAGVNLPGARATSRAVMRSVAGFSGWKPRLRVDDVLAASGVDTTFVWGDKDVHASPQGAQDLSVRMTKARVAVIAGAGHIPHLDHPNQVAAAIGQPLGETRSDDELSAF